MNVRIPMTILAAACLLGAACRRDSNVKDRRDADEMFSRICALTKEYTARLQSAPDSTDWAGTCAEFEEKLDKISFSYPPDTDILLTEGQNDTIYTLMQEYAKERGRRLHGFRYPEEEPDSVSVTDSIAHVALPNMPTGGGGHASRSPGN